MKLTRAVIEVTFALLDDPDGRHWGWDLCKVTHLPSGVVYPILQRMLVEGVLADGWENPAEITERRPPRRYYQITPSGLGELAAMSSRAAAMRALPQRRLGVV